jgi:AraC family transcriptional regulator
MTYWQREISTTPSMIAPVEAAPNPRALPKMSPGQWSEALSATLLTNGAWGGRAGSVRTWSGDNVDILQPPLDHHLVVLHLGGAKNVNRIGEGASVSRDVELASVTIIPAGAHYLWRTQGPIDFVHLYIDPARFSHMVKQDFNTDPSQAELREAIGTQDPFLAEAIKEMARVVSSGGAEGPAYFERLLDVSLAQLARRHSSLGEVSALARNALPPKRLRRVQDYIESNLANPIDLSELASVANLSRFHFSRAFQDTVGETPLAYVNSRRIESAKRLVLQTEEPLSTVASQCGFLSQSHFSRNFKKLTGCTPTAYRGLAV